MLSEDNSASVPAPRGRNGAPAPAPKGNQYAKGNKGPRGDFLTQKLISQLSEVVTRDKPKLEYYKHGGKMKKRLVISQQTHAKLHFLVEALLENAMNGETDAIKYVFDRIEGRPMSLVPEENNGPLTIQFLQVDKRI